MSGMVKTVLDSRGRLLDFEAVPPQVQQGTAAPQQVDWTPLFAAANLDPSSLQPAEPQWTFLATSDVRAA